MHFQFQFYKNAFKTNVSDKNVSMAPLNHYWSAPNYKWLKKTLFLDGCDFKFQIIRTLNG